MGWNTGVIILNDALSTIEANPEEFTKNLLEAIRNFRGESVNVAVGGHVNAAAVFHQSHADNTGVYALGGNHATRLLEVYNGGKHHTDDEKQSLVNAMRKPQGITPGEVLNLKEKQIPDEVFEAFDELIAKDFQHGSATVMQKEVSLLALKKLKAAGHRGMTQQKIFDNHWLDVEAIYRQRGWNVEYDKPAYNESYEASFRFSKRRVSDV